MLFNFEHLLNTTRVFCMCSVKEMCSASVQSVLMCSRYVLNVFGTIYRQQQILIMLFIVSLNNIKYPKVIYLLINCLRYQISILSRSIVHKDCNKTGQHELVLIAICHHECNTRSMNLLPDSINH